MKEIKTTDQVSLDMEAYVNKLEKTLKQGFKGHIEEVTPISSSQFFKDDSGKYEDREGISVAVKLEVDKELKNTSPAEFTQFFSKPNLRGYEQSNLFLFKKKYGAVPIKGMQVECIIDESGFFRIML